MFEAVGFFPLHNFDLSPIQWKAGTTMIRKTWYSWAGLLQFLLFSVAFGCIFFLIIIFVFLFKEVLPLFYDGVGENVLSWRDFFVPEYSDAERRFLWQPSGIPPKYNVVPLIWGSIKISFISLMFGLPVAILASIYTSELASPKIQRCIKPCVEILAGLPGVVLGFLGLLVFSEYFFQLFGWSYRLNGFIAGFCLSIAVIPIAYTIADDILSNIPKSYREASLALGAMPVQTIVRVILPVAMPGLLAAGMLAFGRAVGETMIVLMLSGNAPLVSLDLFMPLRTLSATIAGEMGETVFGSQHYMILFLLGLMLFAITFFVNWVVGIVIQRFKKNMKGL